MPTVPFSIFKLREILVSIHADEILRIPLFSYEFMYLFCNRKKVYQNWVTLNASHPACDRPCALLQKKETLRALANSKWFDYRNHSVLKTRVPNSWSAVGKDSEWLRPVFFLRKRSKPRLSGQWPCMPTVSRSWTSMSAVRRKRIKTLAPGRPCYR